MVKNEASPSLGNGPGAQPHDLITLLDAIDEAPAARQLRHLTYELLGVQPGAAMLDVGCGPGRAVHELGALGVRAHGVDIDSRMIAVARQRWPKADFRVAGAYALPFGDGTVSGYRADKVFHELDDPARAVAEARRVLAPGGRIVLIGQDWDTFLIDADDAALTRTIVHARADMVPGPRTARRFRNLLLDAGFRDVEVQVHTGIFTDTMMLPMLSGLAEAACATGRIGRSAADGWFAEQSERADAGRLFLAVPMFVASAGKRPE